jgi:trans-2,3-dihydro-3-hydroxyanthranilate isomerase
VKAGEAMQGEARMTQPLPVVKGVLEDSRNLAAALSLDPSDIAAESPIEAIYNGITVLIVPVRSLAAVREIKFDINGLERIAAQMGAETILAFTREKEAPSSTVHCRVSAPAAGVIEDAATGSANGPLGYYLVRHRLVEVLPLTTIVSEQGYEMKRPSILNVEVETRGAEITAVRVGGGVVIAGRGELNL